MQFKILLKVWVILSICDPFSDVKCVAAEIIVMSKFSKRHVTDDNSKEMTVADHELKLTKCSYLKYILNTFI